MNPLFWHHSDQSVESFPKKLLGKISWKVKAAKSVWNFLPCLQCGYGQSSMLFKEWVLQPVAEVGFSRCDVSGLFTSKRSGSVLMPEEFAWRDFICRTSEKAKNSEEIYKQRAPFIRVDQRESCKMLFWLITKLWKRVCNVLARFRRKKNTSMLFSWFSSWCSQASDYLQAHANPVKSSAWIRVMAQICLGKSCCVFVLPMRHGQQSMVLRTHLMLCNGSKQQTSFPKTFRYQGHCTVFLIETSKGNGRVAFHGLMDAGLWKTRRVWTLQYTVWSFIVYGGCKGI